MNKLIFVDMDDVLADFYSAATDNPYKIVNENLMWEPNFFLNLKPTIGSQNTIRKLQKLGYRVMVLTKPLAGHPECASQKIEWIQRYFPQLHDQIILTHDKTIINGDYLIDDDLESWKIGFEKNGGTFVHFQYGCYNIDGMRQPVHIWNDLLTYFTLIARGIETNI